jgi:hypothetical protein
LVAIETGVTVLHSATSSVSRICARSGIVPQEVDGQPALIELAIGWVTMPPVRVTGSPNGAGAVGGQTYVPL